jgi:hypothetical protein
MKDELQIPPSKMKSSQCFGFIKASLKDIILPFTVSMFLPRPTRVTGRSSGWAGEICPSTNYLLDGVTLPSL